MRRVIFVAAALAALVIGPQRLAAWSNSLNFKVVPFDFDPYRTHLVEAEWEDGIGCPTNATTRPFVEAPPGSGNFVVGPPTPYTDTACPWPSDQHDRRNFGLLLVKTGPTNNDASAGATLNGIRGTTLTELGYDIRKPGNGTGLDAPGDNLDPRGSHCGAGAPRFNIEVYEDPGATYFLGCNSPPPDFDFSGIGWQRLRWGGAVPLTAFRNGSVLTDITGTTVKRLSIVFDEAQDLSGGPDQFGAAVLDNIDVNGTMVGRGPEGPSEKDRDECEGEDKDHRHFHANSSSSRPESSNMSFEDPNEGKKIQMVGGAISIAYAGACVTSVGDALLNEEPGFTVTFAACDLSALSTPLTPSIGNYTITVTGASGVVYQKSQALTSGLVSIHPH
jgi:hypothetical protein